MKQEFGYGVTNVQAQEVSAYQAEVVRQQSTSSVQGYQNLSSGLSNLSGALQEEKRKVGATDERDLRALADATFALKERGITGEAAEKQLAESGLATNRIQRMIGDAGGLDNLREPAFRFRLSELDGQSAWFEAKANLDFVDGEVERLFAGMGVVETDADGNVVPVNVEDYEARAAAMYEAALEDYTKRVEGDPLMLAEFTKNSIPDIASRVSKAKIAARRTREIDFARQTGESLLNTVDLFHAGHDRDGHPVDGDQVATVLEGVWKQNYSLVAEQDRGPLAVTLMKSIGADLDARVARGEIDPLSDEGAEDLEELFDAIESSLPPDMEGRHPEVLQELDKLRADHSSTEIERLGAAVSRKDIRLRGRDQVARANPSVVMSVRHEYLRDFDRDNPQDIEKVRTNLEEIMRTHKNTEEGRQALAEALSNDWTTVPPDEAYAVARALYDQLLDDERRAVDRQYEMGQRDIANAARIKRDAKEKETRDEKESNERLASAELEIYAIARRRTVNEEDLSAIQNKYSELTTLDQLKLERLLMDAKRNGSHVSTIDELVGGPENFLQVWLEKNTPPDTADTSAVPPTAAQQQEVANYWDIAKEQVILENLNADTVERYGSEPRQLRSDLLEDINLRAMSLMQKGVNTQKDGDPGGLNYAQAFDIAKPVGIHLPNMFVTQDNMAQVGPEVFKRANVFAGDEKAQHQLAGDLAQTLTVFNRDTMQTGTFMNELPAAIRQEGVTSSGKRRGSAAAREFATDLEKYATMYTSGDRAERDAAHFALQASFLSNGFVEMGDDGSGLATKLDAAADAAEERSELPSISPREKANLIRMAETLRTVADVPVVPRFDTFEDAMMYKAPEFQPGGKYFGIYITETDRLRTNWEANGVTFEQVREAARDQLAFMLDKNRDLISDSHITQWLVSQSISQ